VLTKGPAVMAEPIAGSAQELADEEGLSFAPTPGPGDSDGGDVYAPEEGSGRSGTTHAAPKVRT
jgi:hypothetical protein